MLAVIVADLPARGAVGVGLTGENQPAVEIAETHGAPRDRGGDLAKGGEGAVGQEVGE